MPSKFRFVIAFLAICLASLVLLNYIVYSSYKQERLSNLKANTDDVWQLVANIQLNELGKQISNIREELQTYLSTKAGGYYHVFIRDQDNSIYPRHHEDSKLDELQLAIAKDLIRNQSEQTGYVIEKDLLFIWTSGEIKQNGLILTLFQIRKNTIFNDFVDNFGTPLAIASVVILWLCGWAAIIVTSLSRRLYLQKSRLESQTKKLSETRDKEVEANKAKSIFLAHMSHEIRTPLTSIIGFSDTLLDSNQSMEERIHAIQTINRSGKHVLNIINEILDLSKIEADKLEIEHLNFSLNELINEITPLVELQATEKDLAFSVNYKYPIPEFICSDPLRVKQVILNLISNAIKFTEHGHVKILISCNFENQLLMVDVIDTGIGISKQQSENIFQEFIQADTSTTRKYGGTGLGLFLSKRLAEMMGGTITMESTPRVGSRFSFTLATGSLENTNVFRNQNELPIAKKIVRSNRSATMLSGKVLLAEDSKDIQELLSVYMRKVGLDLDIVENGAQAVEHAVNNDYDIVLMDMRMPIMDGMTAVSTLRNFGYEQPIIALTANTMKKDQEKCLNAGCNEFLSKPIARDDLISTLSGYLNTVERDDTNKISAPVTSTLLEDEPDMIELVEAYIEQLPGSFEHIKEAQSNNNWPELKELIHKMKGTAGGYGYPELTQLAAQVEFQILNEDYNEVAANITRMEAYILRIIAGAIPDSNIVTLPKTS